MTSAQMRTVRHSVRRLGRKPLDVGQAARNRRLHCRSGFSRDRRFAAAWTSVVPVTASGLKPPPTMHIRGLGAINSRRCMAWRCAAGWHCRSGFSHDPRQLAVAAGAAPTTARPGSFRRVGIGDCTVGAASAATGSSPPSGHRLRPAGVGAKSSPHSRQSALHRAVSRLLTPPQPCTVAKRQRCQSPEYAANQYVTVFSTCGTLFRNVDLEPSPMH